MDFYSFKGMYYKRRMFKNKLSKLPTQAVSKRTEN